MIALSTTNAAAIETPHARRDPGAEAAPPGRTPRGTPAIGIPILAASDDGDADADRELRVRSVRPA
jgi:hypothetical protein